MAPKAIILDSGETLVLEKPPLVKRLGKKLKRDWRLYTFLLIPVAHLLLFSYGPMIGNVIAFRRFVPGGNILGEEWVGLWFFQMFWNNPQFWRVFNNTVILGVLTLLFTFPMPIIFALMLNEVKVGKFKKIIQTLSYLPHFMATVVVVAMIQSLFSLSGPINNLIYALGGERLMFMGMPQWFRTIFVGSRIWQTTGWGTILYLAALTNIDPTLYEAAKIDGANRWKQMWYITLPGIRPTIVTLLILNVGWVLGVNFEQVLLQMNDLTLPIADVIGTYLLRMALESAMFSFSTAIGLFQSLIGITLIIITNFISKKLTESSLW